ncbi:MAG: AarF/ABC1/UbiB kinase family protein [Deltaproteobacteria bacterium]|nr:AarF/ABC1/UbiB kinase family protein [Deltaproteobacteria bacterium]
MFQAFKDLNRLREIAVLAVRHGFGEMLDRTRLWEILGRREKGEARPETSRETTARRFRLLLSDLGPTFIKLGQVLSTRPDLLPAEYIQELSLLQDAVPPEPMDHVVREVEQSFGKPLAELYGSIEEKPLASASIAQVHRARTLTGEEVVVKVQRPGIAGRIRADLDLLYYAARLLEAVVEETGVYTPVGIIEEFDAAIHEELDFLNEARNIREFLRLNQGRDWLAFPQAVDGLCSKTVLTMEFLKGENIRAIDLAKHDRKKLAERILETAFRQLFEDGFFHGDPHPGNILVLEGDRLGVLDLGVVGRVSKQMQENLVMLVLAVALKDADTVARLIYRVATPDKRTNLNAFKQDIQGVLDAYMVKKPILGEIEVKTIVPELLNLALRYHVKIPKEYALLSRALLLVEGMVRWLYPELNIGQAVVPYAKELMFGRYETSGLSTLGMKAFLRFQTFATDVPMQLSQVLLDLEGGKFKVNVGSEDLARIASNLKSLGMITFLGFLACGLTIGAFVSFSKLDFAFHGVPVLGGLAVLLVGFLFGVVATWTAASGRVKKLSLARWLKRKKR